MEFKGYVVINSEAQWELTNPQVHTMQEMREWAMRVLRVNETELDSQFYIESAEVYYNRPEGEPLLREDLDGNVITIAAFLKTRNDMIEDGLCDNEFTYDEYCDQCQDL